MAAALSLVAACAGDDVGASVSASASDSDAASTGEGSSTTDDSSASAGESTSGSMSGSASETGSMTSDASSDATTDATAGTTGTSDSATAGTTSGDPTATTGEPTTTGTTADGGLSADCLFAPFEKGNALGFNYDQFAPVIGSHCKGTNHQEITDIERVVFLGDSITVGTPPTLAQDYYRAQLADALVERFGLEPPSGLWKQVNLLDGVALQQESGDFASCSKWGARTDDFMQDNDQIVDCLPEDTWDERTLVVITMGGNDLAAIVQDGAEGKSPDECIADALAAVDLMREAVEYIADPEKFPNGVFVTFANVYEFTDGTADVSSCAAAGLEPWANPEAMIEMVRAVNEAYLEIAVDTQTDMIFLLENFCGHGYRADDPAGPCYRGPDQDNYFDLTCIHPTPKGHGVITDLFTAVIDE